jgi:hypothetical protein
MQKVEKGSGEIEGVKKHVRIGFPPRTCFVIRYRLSVRSDFPETIAAVDRFITAGLERYLGSLAAFGAGGGVHLAFASERVVSVPLGFSGLPALRTAFRLVSVAF